MKLSKYAQPNRAAKQAKPWNSRLMFHPEAQDALIRGFGKLTATMEVALGPRGRMVAVARDNRLREPELLNDGATIARRFLGFPDRFETMGAFLARHIAWQVEEAVGDGATTAVVIAEHVMREANRLRAAGHNVMRLRWGLDAALHAALAALQSMSHPLEDPAQIASLAESITGDPALGKYIEELFDVVGPYGAVDVRTHYGRGHNVRYINGTFWNQGWASSYFATDAGKATVKDAYVLLTDRQLESAEELAPIMQQVAEEGKRSLVVIANGIAGGALNILVSNLTRGTLTTLGIKAPGLGPEKTEVLQDLAVMTGGRVFLAALDDPIEQATLADLGQAREVQAIRSGFTLIGGKGRPAQMRARSQELRKRIPAAAYGRERNRLIERAGKLLGGVALLEIGGSTESERDYMKDRAREAVHVVRLGLQNGVVPGGGVALLRCREAIDDLALPPDQEAGAAILRAALVAPMRAILTNSGIEASPIIARLETASNGAGYDVMRGEFTDVMAAHIVDPVQVLCEALRAGVSGAMMALTTEVLVHRPRQNRDEEVDFNP